MDGDLGAVRIKDRIVVGLGAELIARHIMQVRLMTSDPLEDGVDGLAAVAFVLLAQLLVFGGHVALPIDVGRELPVVAHDVGTIGGRLRFHAKAGKNAAKRADDEGGVAMVDLRAKDALDDVVECELQRGQIFDVRERRVEMRRMRDGTLNGLVTMAERASADRG